jgi:C1A family cysteine protease
LAFSSLASANVYDSFKDFQMKYDRHYVDAQEAHMRFEQFSENYNFIIEFNKNSQSNNKTHFLEMNGFMDVFNYENVQNKKIVTLLPDISESDDYLLSDMPDSVDWRDDKMVTPVKDQGQCGSCWSFSATEAVESAWAIANGELFDLSEQELVSCDTVDNGCNGGLMDNAFDYIEKNGLVQNKDYLYTARDGTCELTAEPVVWIGGHQDVKTGNELALKQAVTIQPVSVAIQADQNAFRFYKSGVIAQEDCGTKLDHGVLLVGYGTDEIDGDYWLVRNSWGTEWGENGYVRLARTDKKVNAGTCGIALQASYPIV